MMTLKDALSSCQSRVNSFLSDYMKNLPEVSPVLREAMTYGVLLGGKRVRPFLVYTTAELLGGDLKVADAPAAAIECIHAYSLIHDDLPAMDNDELRRGHPTVHVKFGEAQAILAGDALQSQAFEILSHARMPNELLRNQVEMLAVLSRGAGYQGMCGGQEIDLDSEGRLISQEELEKLHRHKTGALIESAVLLGTLCVPEVSDKARSALVAYSRAIGLAFQVWDDVLDIISDTETLGKPQGSDIEENKSTYPKLMGLDNAKKYASDLADKAVAALDDVPGNTDLLKQFARYIVERDH